jgi:putative FmdB family regulatory protein
MPIHEYRCRACSHTFEVLVRGAGLHTCPSCHGQDLERILSSFGVSSDGTSRATLQQARRQFTESSARRDQRRHEQEEVREHVQEDYGLRVPKPED